MYQDQKWANTEERLNSWEYDNTPEEIALFSIQRVTVSPQDSIAITITPDDYSNDDRLSELYSYVNKKQESESTTDDAPSTTRDTPTGTQVQSDTNSPVQPKLGKSKIGKMKVPEKYRHLYQKFMVEQYHIDTTGLIYNVNADGIEKLCMPNKTLANGESLYFVIYKEVHEDRKSVV